MSIDQLEYLENVIQLSFTSLDSQTRQQANEELSRFSNGPESFKELMYIISETQNPYAFHFSCGQLHKLVTTFINSMNEQERKDMRGILSSAIITRSEWFTKKDNRFACETFCKLCARLWRLCWFDIPSNLLNSSNKDSIQTFDDSNPSLIDIALNLVNPNNEIASIIIGFTLLNNIIYDMATNVETIQFPKQKKIMNLFRENHLLRIFMSITTTIEEILKYDSSTISETTMNILDISLDLIIAILNFNKNNQSVDSSEIVYVKPDWKNGLLKTDPYFSVYNMFSAPHSTKALEILISLTSLRKELLIEQDQVDHLKNIIQEIGKILISQIGLNDSFNRHNICRLLYTLKSNFRTDQFIKTNVFIDLVNIYSNFCNSIFDDEEANISTIFYIFNFFKDISQADMHHKIKSQYKSIVYQLVSSFLDSSLKRETYTHETFLSDHEIQCIIESLPKISDESVLDFLNKNFISLAESLKYSIEYNNFSNIDVLEKQMSWILFTISSTSYSKLIRSFGFDIINTTFDIIKLSEQRINAIGKVESSKYFEIASLFFILHFVKSFFKQESAGIETTSSEYLNFILNRILTNLTLWSDNHQIFVLSIEVLIALTEGCVSRKVLYQSPVVKQIIENHNKIDINMPNRSRVAFYKALSKIAFDQLNSELYECFFSIFDQQMQSLRSGLEKKDYSGIEIISQICCNLRGVLASCNSDKYYLAFFNWFYGKNYYIILHECLNYFLFKDLNIAWSIMRFIENLVKNDNRRINFPYTSVNGILLFKDTSKMLIDISNSISKVECSKELIGFDTDSKYKTIHYYYNILCNLLSGDFCKYGVFAIYDDNILINLFNSAILMMSFPIDELSYYKKTQFMLYCTLKNICSLNIYKLLKQDENKALGDPSTVILNIIGLIRSGFKTREHKIIEECSKSLKILIVHQIKLSKQIKPDNILDEQHIQLLIVILFDLFDILINEYYASFEYINKAIYRIIQLHPSSFELIKENFIKSQSSLSHEKGERMSSILNKLFDGVVLNGMDEDEEHFSLNLATFIVRARQFIDLDSFYKYTIVYIKKLLNM